MNRRKDGGRPPGDYEVGYGRPPAETQFRKGTSGNRNGRPPGRKQPEAAAPPTPTAGRNALQQLIHDEINRPINLQENGETITLTAIQAAVRSVGIAAMKGRPHAQRAFLELAAKNQIEEKDRRTYARGLVAHYKANHAQAVEKFKRENPGKFCHLPHPDDVIFNEELGIMDFRGPFTEEGWKSMMFTRNLRDQILFAMNDLLEIRCSPLLSCRIREYAEGLYNAAARLTRELPLRFHEDLKLLCPPDWVPPEHAHVDPIYFGAIGPLPPGMLEQLEAEPDAEKAFAEALASFNGDGEPPKLNQTQHCVAAFGLGLTEPQRRAVLFGISGSGNAPTVIRKLKAVGRKMSVPPHVIVNAQLAVSNIEASRDAAVTLSGFRQSLEA